MAILPTFRHLVERNERHHPHETAMLFEHRRISFAEHAVRTRKLAAALYVFGMRHQDRVAMIAMNCAEYSEFYGAAEVSGFIAAAINFRLAPPEFAYIVNDCTPKVLIFESQYVAMIDALRDQLTSVQHYVCIGESVPSWAAPYEELLAGADAAGPPLRPISSDIVTILYTSGTTGRPKGVMTTHEAGMWIAEMQAIEMSTDVGNRFLIVMPMYHLGGRAMQSGQHLRGGTVVLHRKFDPAEVARCIQEYRINQVHLAPTMLQAVLDLPDIDRYDVSSVKSLMHAAAPISITLRKRALRRFGPILIDGYGSTETGGTMLRKNQQKLDGTPEEQKRLASVGQAMLHCEVRIVDDNDVEVTPGQVGELCFKSPQTMSGYWNNAAATVEALRGGWMHTGDMAFMDKEGFVYLVDRKKDLIISGGENIYSREVEEAVMSHADVSDAAVIGTPDGYWGESVLAVVVCSAGRSVDPAVLIAHCKTQIASYKTPKRIEYIDALPRLASGKVNKVALRERFGKADR